MNLSDYKGEEALDIIVELLEPITKIMSDKEIAEAYQKVSKLEAIKIAIKNHKKEVIEILAILDGEDPAKYEVNIFTLPAKILEILNDPEFLNLFGSQGQTGGAISSGSVLENIKAQEQ